MIQQIDFELQRRYLLSEGTSPHHPWGNLQYHSYPSSKAMKYDACCGMSAVGIDAVGLAMGYVNATRAQRKEIYDKHRYYVQGIMWFRALGLSLGLGFDLGNATQIY